MSRSVSERLQAEGWLPVTHVACGQLFGWIAASPRDYDVDYNGFTGSMWPLGENNHLQPDGSSVRADDEIECPSCHASPGTLGVPFRRTRDGSWWAV